MRRCSNDRPMVIMGLLLEKRAIRELVPSKVVHVSRINFS